MSVTFTPAERRLLGHHLDPGMCSVATYSRESYATLYAKVLKMFVASRDGNFNPDLSAIERVVHMACGDEPRGSEETVRTPVEINVPSDSESSVASDLEGGPALEEPTSGVVERSDAEESFHDFPNVPLESLVVHNFSGLVHVLNEDCFLVCGKRMSCNFKPLSAVDLDISMFEGCAHCRRPFRRESLA